MISLLRVLPLFPDYKQKAVTTSYDDGCVGDEKMMEIMKRYGIRGTFNLNSGYMTGKLSASDKGRMTPEIMKGRYDNVNFETAIHFETHIVPDHSPLSYTALDVLDDREYLEKLFGCVIRGCAYPFGAYNDDVIDMLRRCGIVYARTVRSTHGFALPHKPLALDPTCHHNDPALFELVDKFIGKTPLDHEEPWLFYLWGHAYEFDNDNNWDRFEEFCKRISGDDKVWYATNIDIVDYLRAFDRLEYSSYGTIIKNTSSREVFIKAQVHHPVRKWVQTSIKPGETVNIEKLI